MVPKSQRVASFAAARLRFRYRFRLRYRWLASRATTDRSPTIWRGAAVLPVARRLPRASRWANLPRVPCRTIILTLALLLGPWFGARAADRPNVILILADDLGWGDPRCYNPDSKIPTPHLDRLAAEGLRFLDAHSPSAVCTPTRYALLTGRYAWRTRLRRGVLWGYSPPLIEPDRPTLATFLRAHGYATACIGKWHLGLRYATPTPAEFGDTLQPQADPALIDWSQPLREGPPTAGFDYSFCIPASLDMVPYVYLENGRATAPPEGRTPGSRHQRQGGGGFWREGPIAPDFEIADCHPNLVRRALEYLRQRPAGEPFFLYLALTSPHDPWVPTAEFLGRSQAGPRGDFVAQVDDAVGQVLQVLDQRGLSRNTLVIFTSDNGAHWLPDERTSTRHAANGPWRGMKSDIYEGGHRVPFLVRWPARVRPGTASEAVIGLQDLFATLAEILDRPLPPRAAEDSVSFFRDLRGRGGSRRPPLVHHSIDGTFALRVGPWKLVDGSGSGGWTAAIRREPGQLYRLDRDPTESTNLWDSHSRRRTSLQRQLRDIRQGSLPNSPPHEPPR